MLCPHFKPVDADLAPALVNLVINPVDRNCRVVRPRHRKPHSSANIHHTRFVFSPYGMRGVLVMQNVMERPRLKITVVLVERHALEGGFT